MLARCAEGDLNAEAAETQRAAEKTRGIAPALELSGLMRKNWENGPGDKLKNDSKPKAELLQGTLDMLILKSLSLGPRHGYGIIQRIQQVSDGMLTVEQGSLYPALYRIEQRGWITSKWEISETNRKAKFYRLTRTGERQLQREEESWDRLALAIAKVRQAT
jgi:PadR family transcriptional regulator PadR